MRIDGLAKSSRNKYLDVTERRAALCLYQAVKRGQQVMKKGIDGETVLKEMCSIIEAEPLARIEYVRMEHCSVSGKIFPELYLQGSGGVDQTKLKILKEFLNRW